MNPDVCFLLAGRQTNTAKGSKQRFSSVIPGQLGKAFKKRTLQTLASMHNADFVLVYSPENCDLNY